MALELDDVRRQARQIALPDLGVEGQARIGAAEVALVGADPGDPALEAAARYLAGAGVRRLRVIGDDPGPLAAGVAAVDGRAAVATAPWPGGGVAWVEALRGASLVVRSGFDDDPMLRAAVRLGIPVVVARVTATGDIDVLAFRRHGPCPHAALDIPPARAAGDAAATGGGQGTAAALRVAAGALAAAEALWILARPGEPPRARHLRLGGGDDAGTREIPWTPECFACGGTATEVVPS
jgi:sulfur-carrier protein adenylyltransferase/sulfurtransferase